MKIKLLSVLLFFLISNSRASISDNIILQGEILAVYSKNYTAGFSLFSDFMGCEADFFMEEGLQTSIHGVDMEAIPGKYDLIIRSDNMIFDIYPIYVIHGNFQDERLSVAKKFVEFTPEILKRIKREYNNIIKIYTKPPEKKLFSGNFERPLRFLTVTSKFGTRRIYNNTISGRHGGIDFRAATGTSVRATNDGIVEYEAPHYLAGNIVVINHGLGIFSRYLHLSQIFVKRGQKVKKGQIIARSGATGRITGPHLDFRLRVNGANINPMQLLNFHF